MISSFQITNPASNDILSFDNTSQKWTNKSQTTAVTQYVTSTYYISQSGSNTNTGLTSASPLLTVAEALSRSNSRNIKLIFAGSSTAYACDLSGLSSGSTVILEYDGPIGFASWNRLLDTVTTTSTMNTITDGSTNRLWYQSISAPTASRNSYLGAIARVGANNYLIGDQTSNTLYYQTSNATGSGVGVGIYNAPVTLSIPGLFSSMQTNIQIIANCVEISCSAGSNFNNNNLTLNYSKWYNSGSVAMYSNSSITAYNSGIGMGVSLVFYAPTSQMNNKIFLKNSSLTTLSAGNLFQFMDVYIENSLVMQPIGTYIACYHGNFHILSSCLVGCLALSACSYKMLASAVVQLSGYRTVQSTNYIDQCSSGLLYLTRLAVSYTIPVLRVNDANMDVVGTVYVQNDSVNTESMFRIEDNSNVTLDQRIYFVGYGANAFLITGNSCLYNNSTANFTSTLHYSTLTGYDIYMTEYAKYIALNAQANFNKGALGFAYDATNSRTISQATYASASLPYRLCAGEIFNANHSGLVPSTSGASTGAYLDKNGTWSIPLAVVDSYNTNTTLTALNQYVICNSGLTTLTLLATASATHGQRFIVKNNTGSSISVTTPTIPKIVDLSGATVASVTVMYGASATFIYNSSDTLYYQFM